MISNCSAVLNVHRLFLKLNRSICNKLPVLPDHSFPASSTGREGGAGSFLFLCKISRWQVFENIELLLDVLDTFSPRSGMHKLRGGYVCYSGYVIRAVWNICSYPTGRAGGRPSLMTYKNRGRKEGGLESEAALFV